MRAPRTWESDGNTATELGFCNLERARAFGLCTKYSTLQAHGSFQNSDEGSIRATHQNGRHPQRVL